jgi:hypothetical protein
MWMRIDGDIVNLEGFSACGNRICREAGLRVLQRKQFGSHCQTAEFGRVTLFRALVIRLVEKL